MKDVSLVFVWMYRVRWAARWAFVIRAPLWVLLHVPPATLDTCHIARTPSQ